MAPVFSRKAWRSVWHMNIMESHHGKVRERCKRERKMFLSRMAIAEGDHFKNIAAIDDALSSSVQ